MSQKQYRLLARAQIDGEVREAGYVFTLAEGERGPERAVIASNIGGMAWRRAKELAPDHAGWPVGWFMPDEPTMRDEPLYEPVTT
jgi:hypothetical protein